VKLAAWLALTMTAAVALVVWTFPDRIEHRGRLHVVGHDVVVCAAEHPRDGRTQLLHHVADCAGHLIRRL